MSLMRKNQEKFKDGIPTPATLSPAASGGKGLMDRQQLYTLLDNALAEDLKGLKSMHSVEAKIRHKREVLLPKYQDYADRLRTKGWDHVLLPYYMLWLLDAGQMEEGVMLGLIVADRNIPMPEPFQRPAYIVLADLVLDWSEIQESEGRSPEPYFSMLFDLVKGDDRNEPWDLPDKLAAKYYRLAGMLAEAKEEDEAALALFERAHELGAKVKTKLDNVKKRLDVQDTD